MVLEKSKSKPKMTEKKKKSSEESLLETLMVVIPTVTTYFIGQEVAEDLGTTPLAFVGFAMLAAMLGASVIFLVKDKERPIKFLAAGLITLISFAAIFLFVSGPSDEEIIAQDWITQKIGNLEFDSPTELELVSNEVPDSVTWFYRSLENYSDHDNERMTYLMRAEILPDSIPPDSLTIDQVFSGALYGLLSPVADDLTDIELEVFSSDEEEISVMFTFQINEEEVHGYNYSILQGYLFESLWLIPVKRGYSKEYIEEFEIGIIPDYVKVPESSGI